MGTIETWLEKCFAVDAKMDLYGEIVPLYYSILMICVSEGVQKIILWEHAHQSM